MMKLVVDIPPWAEERHIIVLAGSEPIAILKKKPIKNAAQPEGWIEWVKTERCNLCGLCCLDPTVDDPDWPFGTKRLEIDGKVQWVCGVLTREMEEDRPIYRCMAGHLSPWGCIAKNPPHLPHPECSIRYEEV